MVPVSPETIAAARKLKTSAVADLLTSQYASVYRIAYALSGRWDVGRGIARFVLARSVRFMPKWDPDDDPANWFHRFTIMTSRRSAKHRAEPKKDVLVEQAIDVDGEYVAFVAALRHLEPQQREAFLLHVGERLNDRYAALAMDCSTEAAHNHLHSAEKNLRLVAGPSMNMLTQKLADAYMHLTPADDSVIPAVNRVVFRQVRLRRALRLILRLVQLAIVATLIWAGWWLYHSVRR
ncbi:MAG: polymerase sigma-70 factor, subfamily [Phycisphaerales bacterium]|jgi:DNA-directed RNA polymerase specialized sigma24 family protein|nr:polymerase sigma-70 factor, subfamily [Phycisphaerales bacterium]